MLKAFVFGLFFTFSLFSFAVDDSTEASVDRGKIFFKPVRFATGVAWAKVDSECLMLEQLKRSIVSSARDFELEIDFLDEGSGEESGRVVQVEIVEIDPNRWKFGSVRPYSSAKYRVAIYQDGKLLSSGERALNSAVALGACARLEKIANAFGRPIVQWVFRNIGDDGSVLSPLSLLDSDDASTLREIAMQLYNTSNFNEAYLDAAAQKIWSQRASKDRYMVDALAWLCKYIGLSERGRYRSFLESLEKDVGRGKLKKYVKSALEAIPKNGSLEAQFSIQGEAASGYEGRMENEISSM